MARALEKLPRVRRALRSVALVAAITILLFMLCEGLASVVLLASDLARSSPTADLAERRHTRYDPELGWVNLPSVEIEDMYGPGIALRTNSQGFRNDVDFTEEIPPGVVRIICCGDSFTLGYGVANEDTWCSQLDIPGVRLECVNMGQGGYGVHQAYLWYLREGRKLKHQLLVFAFIQLDFERMRTTSFLGYGTPRVRVDSAGELEVTNVPVPRLAYRSAWLKRNGDALRRLRTAQAFQALFGTDAPDELPWSEVYETSFRIFDELVEAQRQDSGDVLFVYLPAWGDLATKTRTRQRIARYMAQRAYLYVDMTEAFEELSPARALELFLPQGDLEYPDASGHYTPAGNRLVAEHLSRVLAQHPIVQAVRAEADGR